MYHHSCEVSKAHLGISNKGVCMSTVHSQEKKSILNVNVPIYKDMPADGTVIVSAGVCDCLQGESKTKQVGTNSQSKLEQKPAQKVLLGLRNNKKILFVNITVH